MSLIRMFKVGPEVYLRASSTVSPTTAAVLISDPFMTLFQFSSNIAPLSMYFLRFSQASLILDAKIVIWTPLTNKPDKNPAKILGPIIKPRAKGARMTKAPGAIISINEALVEILIQAL